VRLGVPVPGYVASKDLKRSGEKETHVNHVNTVKVRYFLAHLTPFILKWQKRKGAAVSYHSDRTESPESIKKTAGEPVGKRTSRMCSNYLTWL
jgi:hypothetical protein